MSASSRNDRDWVGNILILFPFAKVQIDVSDQPPLEAPAVAPLSPMPGPLLYPSLEKNENKIRSS